MFMFVILFGLSMDYHVFILSRIREAYDRGLSTDKAIAHGIKSTAGTVTSAAVVMVGVFAVFTVLPYVDFKEMGIGLAAAVLIDATIVRAVLLPASMKLLGEKNWYLPRWLQWLPRLEHELLRRADRDAGRDRARRLGAKRTHHDHAVAPAPGATASSFRKADMTLTHLDRQLKEAGNAPEALRLDSVTKRYGSGGNAVTALDELSLTLPARSFTAVMGPSGSGKSTFLHLAAGLDRPTSGSIWLGDADLASLSEDALSRLRRERIGFVFQSFNLIPSLTAAQNIVLPLRLAKQRPDRAWIAEVTERVGLADRASTSPASSPGGQQQRVAIARALATGPT